jgi:hypothetical protein
VTVSPAGTPSEVITIFVEGRIPTDDPYAIWGHHPVKPPKGHVYVLFEDNGERRREPQSYAISRRWSKAGVLFRLAMRLGGPIVLTR